MSRAAFRVGAVLVLLGASIFLWKAVVLGVPVLPSHPAGLWRAELSVTARGRGGRGSVQAPLASTAPGQVVFDERFVSGPLLFSIRLEDGQRVGVWTGVFDGVVPLAHAFRVRLSEHVVDLPAGPQPPPPTEILEAWTRGTPEIPAYAPEMLKALETLALPGPFDPAARLRTILGFVTDEVATVAAGSDDAFLTLAAREGTVEGKTLLLVTLLRAAGIPARPVLGFDLEAGHEPARTAWAEAWVGGWIPLSPADGTLGVKPAHRLAVRVGSLELLRTTGVGAASARFDALREALRPEELAVLMTPPSPWLAPFSLHRLPVGTQASLRVLLVLPLGALVVAIFRNLVGVPTFGTFMPILIALALRATSLGVGLAMVVGVLGIGILGRALLERLRLLLVPRLGVLLSMVVLAITALAVAGRSLELHAMLAGVLFPIVILTMLIERFSVVLAEEGLREAGIRAAGSTVVAVVAYPLFQSATVQHVMFGFPELVICVMGVLVWIGGYMGYRVSDLLRFRSLASDPDA